MDGTVTESGGESTAFAAGVAAATAEQATETAAEAEQTAESAEMVADVALSVAGDANETAWDARAAVDELRNEIIGRLDELGTREAPAGGMPPGGEGQAAPAPEKKETPAAPAATTEKKSRSGYGAKSWFGND